MTSNANANDIQRKRKYKRHQLISPANSVGEAIEKMLAEKKISSKINYEVLRDLTESSTCSTNNSENADPAENIKGSKLERRYL